MNNLRRFWFILLPTMFLLIIWFLTGLNTVACCKHIGNVGPTGGGVGFWGYVYLDDTPIENALVTISRAGEDVVGCVYWGNGSTCPQGIGVGQAHIIEDNPYHATDISGLIDEIRGTNGLPTEPVDLMVRVTYTNPETQIRYEASEVITVEAGDFNEYNEIRLDISLYPSYSNGSGVPVPADFILLENTTVQDNRLKLAFDGLLQNTQTEQMELNQKDYAFETQGDSYLAYNPTQQLHIEITSSKFKLLNQASDEFWAMEMEVEGANLPAASPFLAQANTLSNLSQTYVNQEQWVEHSLTLPSNGSEAVVKLALNPAGLTPALVEGQAQLNWQTAGGEIALQSSWFASDEQGQPVLVELSLTEDGQSLLIKLPPSDGNISLSSYWTRELSTQPDWSSFGEYTTDLFGYAINTAGDVNCDGYGDVIIGAPTYTGGVGYKGKVYVYYGSPDGLPNQPSWSVVGDEPEMEQFGFRVSTAGDINGDGCADILISDPYYANDNGLVVAYFGSTTGLGISNREPDWRVENYGNRFGYYIGPAGNVNGQEGGHSYDDILITPETASKAYVFHGGVEPDLNVDWLYTMTFYGPRFSATLAGDVNKDGFDDILVTQSSSTEGAIQIFNGSAIGLLDTHNQIIDDASGGFGHLTGNRAGDINGDGYGDILVFSNEGDNFRLYLGSNNNLDPSPARQINGYVLIDGYQTKPEPLGDVNGDQYEDVLVLNGPPQGGIGNEPSEAHLFLGGSNYFNNQPDLNITNLASNVGNGVIRGIGDVNGDGYSDFMLTKSFDPGEVWAFYGSAHHPTQKQELPGDSQTNYGHTVQVVGDINNDGLDDVAIGEPVFNQSIGQVNLYFGTHNNVGVSNHITLQGSTPNENFGSAIAGGLDINGDGYLDLIVGSPNFDNGQGKITIYPGSSSGPQTNPITINGQGGHFGQSISKAGDVNGDGYGDFIVGVPEQDTAYLYLGNLFLNNLMAVEINGPLNSHFGYSVVGGGDANGDGLSDVLIGSPNFDNGLGAVWLYTGAYPNININLSPMWQGVGNVVSNYGESLAFSDVNGDSFTDIIVGAYGYENNRGRIFIYNGHPLNISRNANQFISGQTASALGTQLGAGNFNNDEWGDIVASAPQYGQGQSHEGALLVYYGSSTGLQVTGYALIESEQEIGYLGSSLGVGGDINGDGFTDILATLPTYGSVRLYAGNRGNSLNSYPKQLMESGEFIQPFALINHNDHMFCGLTGGTLATLRELKLMCQVAPVNETYESENARTVLSSIISTLEPTTTLTIQGPDLLPGIAYKWRARWVYAEGNWVGQQYSPWFSPSWNGHSEADFRTTVGSIAANIITPSEVRAGVPFTITAQTLPITATMPIQYNWQIENSKGQIIFNESISDGLTNSIIFTPQASDILKISLRVTSGNGEPASPVTKYIEVAPYLVGTAVTKLITPTVNNGVLRWDTVRLVADVPPNTTLQAYVLDSNQNPINCVSPTPLSDGENYLSIACVNPAAYPSIHLGFTLTTDQPGLSPAVSNWSVRWLELDAPLHRLAGQAKDGYGNVLVNATASLYISNTLATTTPTDEHGWYEFANLTSGPNTPYVVKVTLQEYEGAFQIQELENVAVYLETPPLYLAPQTIFTTKVADVNFQRHQTEYTSNVSDPSRLDDLAIMYHHSYEVLTFIHTELQEPNLAPFTLKAFDPALSGAEYEEETATIFIGESNSWYNNPNRPMNREWHEIFHHLMVHTVGFIPDASVCTPPNPFQNHGGYRNSCTSDSWSEGWAEFWATVLADHLNWGTPGIYQMAYDRRLGVINLEVDHPAWEGRCNLGQSPCYHREEFAVASTLWDLYDESSDHRDQLHIPLNELWTILKQSHLHDMKDVYDALVVAGIGQTDSQPDACGLNDLDEIFVVHGFFHDVNENKKHSCEEVEAEDSIGRAANGFAPPRSDRRAAPAIENGIEISSNAPISMPITATVQVTFEEHPEWNYSYEALVIENNIYIEPPTTDYSAHINIEIYTENGGQSVESRSFTNEEYWSAFANTSQGDAVLTLPFVIRWFGYLPLINR